MIELEIKSKKDKDDVYADLAISFKVDKDIVDIMAIIGRQDVHNINQNK